MVATFLFRGTEMPILYLMEVIMLEITETPRG